MITTSKLSINIKSQKKLLTDFLNENGLDYEDLEVCYAAFDNDKLVAAGGRAGSVLKCFAVDPQRREDGLFDLIISSLVSDAYLAGHKDLFVFTKKDYIRVFEAFSFKVLAKTERSCLLFKSDRVLTDFLPLSPFDKRENIGAIVMNANPFTLGHLYLVKRALEKSDKVLVFVVENDRSFFSFKDRFFMVKEGLRDLERVLVLPSSQFLISASTFPSYFLKEQRLISEEHARIDALVFKNFFIDFYGIKARFLGSEPLDPGTAIYNRVLTECLKDKCRVEIIERKEYGKRPISASRVREAFNSGRLDDIKDLVPVTSYDYLEKIL